MNECEDEAIYAWLNDNSGHTTSTQESILDNWSDDGTVGVQDNINPDGDKKSRIEEVKRDIKDSETGEDDEIIIDQSNADESYKAKCEHDDCSVPIELTCAMCGHSYCCEHWGNTPSMCKSCFEADQIASEDS